MNLKLRLFFLLPIIALTCPVAQSPPAWATSYSKAPVPLLKKGAPVSWWFVFKFNAASFPGCSDSEQRQCLFGGEAQDYNGKYSQQYVYASSKYPRLQASAGCSGDTTADPLGATFDQIYNGSFHYVIWNDQFYESPEIHGCGEACSAPWGHSKGLLAWNEAGKGMVLQVSTPSWPASGNHQIPRQNEGNTLGCLHHNNVMVSQHFFALKLSKNDVIKVLNALQNASVVTDINNPQLVNNGGPEVIQNLVKKLGVKSASPRALHEKLSSGVEIISKPSNLAVPPWQMVSAILEGVSLRTATWWSSPKIPTTDNNSAVTCWDDSLGAPGPVEIATTGQWGGTVFGLTGGGGRNFNHAKIGVSTSSPHHYAIFGDMNQQGALTGTCPRSQNGRGGLFYVLDNASLFNGIQALIEGDTAAPN